MSLRRRCSPYGHAVRALAALVGLGTSSAVATAPCGKGKDKCPVLLQVSQHRSVAGPQANASLADLGHNGMNDVELDGSQISFPGPRLSFEDAVKRLGSMDHVVLREGRGETSVDGLADLAVIYVSGREDFEVALRQAVLRYAPIGDIFKTPGKTPDNFLKAMEFAFEKFPQASWYYIADDDSFVHLERLAQLSATLDPKENVYLGNADCKDDQCGWINVKCQREEMDTGRKRNPGWACGGPGVLLSQQLVKSMAARNCGSFYSPEPPPVCCGDMVLACCAYDAWEAFMVRDAPTFNVGNVTELLDLDSEPAVAVHKITPETTLKLGDLYNAHLPKVH